MAALISMLVAAFRRRWKYLREHPDEGSSTVETVLLISLLVALAITVIGIIAAKIIAKANSINLG
jgi:hypothetical protein